jgi:beta-galactosidase/beta-glucuronidase
MQWVYEWESPEFYSMFISEWQTTSAWMGQTWDDYKESLMAKRHIALMSINDYHMAHYTWMIPQ